MAAKKDVFGRFEDDFSKLSLPGFVIPFYTDMMDHVQSSVGFSDVERDLIKSTIENTLLHAGNYSLRGGKVCGRDFIAALEEPISILRNNSEGFISKYSAQLIDEFREDVSDAYMRRTSLRGVDGAFYEYIGCKNNDGRCLCHHNGEVYDGLFKGKLFYGLGKDESHSLGDAIFRMSERSLEE
jgi:hypothetical protein